MPLSEEEQRVLAEIERQFYEEDPALARAVRSRRPPRSGPRRVIWPVLGFLASLVVLLAGFTQHWALGLLGFLGMVGCLFVLQSQLRALSKGAGSALAGRLAARSGLRLSPSDRRRRFKRD